ncbi:MAG: hypothetical protein ONB11_11190 [candidate division KSB1 bacterium]|nr:hypothetical protein [candidate division KSB1 bacterium]MDZ7342719.1 hypothetical protein [candidate division KSB1 bacterium]
METKMIGQEIEAFCRKCKTDTFHVITALNQDKIDKVMCKQCMSYHKYRPSATASELAAPKKAKKTPTPIVQRESEEKPARRARRDKWSRLLDGMDFGMAIEYDMNRVYALEMPIHHKIFGFGVVKNVISDQKIEVLFQDGEKILVQNLHR